MLSSVVSGGPIEFCWLLFLDLVSNEIYLLVVGLSCGLSWFLWLDFKEEGFQLFLALCRGWLKFNGVSFLFPGVGSLMSTSWLLVCL